MKILFVSNDSLLYGSSKSMINLILELKKLYNYDISVILPKKGDLEKELKSRKIEYKIFRYYSWIHPKDENKKIVYFIKKILTLLSVVPLAMWMKKENIDIVHSNNSAVYIGALAAKIAKKRHVWHIREFVEEDHNFVFFNKNKTLKMFNDSNDIIYISKAIENKYKNAIIEPKTHLIYNGIPIEEYKNDYIPDVTDYYKIIIVGAISKTKGHLDAIKAIQELKKRNLTNIKLLIAGDGVCKKEYEKYVIENKLQDNIEFLGFVNNLSNIRKQTNISLVCSKNEAFGRVTIESMCAKNLVIGSNTGGTIELVQDKKTGFLYSEGDYIDLADKIEYAINNWKKCKKIVENAYNYAINNFTITKCAKGVNEVYKYLLEENNNNDN